MPSRQQRPVSVTHTIVILSGALLMLIGGICAVVGIGGAATFDGKLGNMSFTTTSVGLAVMTVGALETGYIATHLPSGVRTFAGHSDAGARARHAGIARAALFAVAIICAIVAGVLIWAAN